MTQEMIPLFPKDVKCFQISRKYTDGKAQKPISHGKLFTIK